MLTPPTAFIPLSATPDTTTWARRVNSRWIVHHDLRGSAERFLDYLEETDPARYQRGCERARRLVETCEPALDPKPSFYAGLFSVATRAEQRYFLHGHSFITAALAGKSRKNLGDLAGASPDTLEKIQRLRARLDALERPRNGPNGTIR